MRNIETSQSIELVIQGQQLAEDHLRNKMVIRHDNITVGTCDLIIEYGRCAHFDGVEIKKKFRHRGFGLATYLRAIEIAHQEGVPFQTQEVTQTEDAKRIWDVLAECGVATVIEPFHFSFRHDDGRARYTGKLVVPVP